MNISSIFGRNARRPPAAGAVPAPGEPTLRAPAGVRFMAGEHVLLLVVTLPRMSAAQRRVAAAFAIEDQIARPLDEVVVSVGPELSEKQWLVAVTDRAALPPDTAPGCRVLPDTLALPVPSPGHWAAWEAEGRAMVRLPDGTGFATPAKNLPMLHQIAGAPAIVLYRGTIILDHVLAALPPPDLPARFDLSDRQGRTFAVSPLARSLMSIAAVAAFGHVAILAVDLLSLSRHHSERAAQLRLSAGAAPDSKIDDLLARILAPAPQAPDAGFLGLLSDSFAAIDSYSESVSLRDLSYAATGNSLALTFQAADLGTLQQVETELVAAGFSVTSGPAISGNGAAEQQMTLAGPSP